MVCPTWEKLIKFVIDFVNRKTPQSYSKQKDVRHVNNVFDFPMWKLKRVNIAWTIQT